MSISRFFRLGSVLAALSLAATATAAEIPDSVRIPLRTYKVKSEDGNGRIFKLGIEVSLGGGDFKMYEFDTGASGFYAAYNRQWWKSYKTFNIPFTQNYSSGIEYTGVIATTTVDLGHDIPPIRTNVGMIENGSGGSVDNWDRDVKRGVAPLYQHFFGDFGLALGTGNGLYAILPQLPGNLSSGFIVSTGGNRAPDAGVTVGLTESLRSQFPILVKMHGESGNYPKLSNQSESRRVYQQQLIDGTLTLRRSGGMISNSTSIVLDTGAPSTEIHDIKSGFGIPPALIRGGGIRNGTRLSLVASGKNTPAWPLSFQVGDATGFTKVGITTKENTGHKAAYVNAGLNAFFRYDVMFDVENGVVGFRRILLGKPQLRVYGKRKFESEKAELVIRGSARGGKQLIAYVEYKQGEAGEFQRIEGTKLWSTRVVLEPGKNEFFFRAVDIAGTVSETVTVQVEGTK